MVTVLHRSSSGYWFHLHVEVKNIFLAFELEELSNRVYIVVSSTCELLAIKKTNISSSLVQVLESDDLMGILVLFVKVFVDEELLGARTQ